MISIMTNIWNHFAHPESFRAPRLPKVRSLRKENKLKNDCGCPLRVEFILKTDSGYPKDTGVTLFTLATSGNPLRYNTHRSAPQVSTRALSHSRGPGARQKFKMSPPRSTRSTPEYIRNFYHHCLFFTFSDFSRLMLGKAPVDLTSAGADPG